VKLALVVLSLAANISLATVLVVYKQRYDDKETRARKFDLYCSGVRDAMIADVRDFQDPYFRASARQRFLQSVSFHSSFEISMCSTAQLDLSRCAMAYGDDCHLRLAQDAADSIPRFEDR
jgi:hypothetical protein